MIRISRDERMQLEDKFGFKIGREMHRTYSKPKSYYLVETNRNLALLNKVRHGK